MLKYLSFLMFIGACSTHKPRTPIAKSAESAPVSPTISEEVEDTVADREPFNVKIASTASAAFRKAAVGKWVEFFSNKDAERFQRYLDRGDPYKKLIETILREENVPVEIYYLGLIESGYHSSASSSASAVGFWQFIRGTADRYNLKVNAWVDERMDPIRSTRAAARYLRDLYNVFNSWELAFAAYNAGEGRILSAVMRGNTRDYWTLAEEGILPAETANYVAKFLGAQVVGEHRAAHGFKAQASDSLSGFKLVSIPALVSVEEMARVAEVDAESIKLWNPHLIRDQTPPKNLSYAVWMVGSSAAKLSANVRELRSSRMAYAPKAPVLAKIATPAKKRPMPTRVAYKSKPNPKMKLVRYKVREGDNLSTIAGRFRTSVTDLMKANNLRREHLYAGEIIRVNKPSDI